MSKKSLRAEDGEIVVRDDGGDMVPAKSRPLSAMDAMMLRPSDIIRFSVYDHEETKLFGVMRDEMMLRRKGESVKSWESRCDEAQEWNRRRSRLMTAVFVARVMLVYGPDSEGVRALLVAFGLMTGRFWEMAFADQETHRLIPYDGLVKLLTGGGNEGEGSEADSAEGSAGVSGSEA